METVTTKKERETMSDWTVLEAPLLGFCSPMRCLDSKPQRVVTIEIERL
jgi:hypothetical protein